MSVNYISKVGVGVLEEEITYTSLTEHGKNIVKDIVSDYELEVNEEDMDVWFSDNVGEYEIFDILGLQVNTGNYFTGETGYRGVDVDLNNPEPYKEEFRKVVNLEPKIFNGVLVY